MEAAVSIPGTRDGTNVVLSRGHGSPGSPSRPSIRPSDDGVGVVEMNANFERNNPGAGRGVGCLGGSSVEENTTDPVGVESSLGAAPRLESHDVQVVAQPGVVGGRGGGRVDDVDSATQRPNGVGLSRVDAA